MLNEIKQSQENKNIRKSYIEIGEILRDPGVAKIFDFDGTIFNTHIIQKASSDGTFAAMGLTINITSEFAASFKGKSDEDIYALIFCKDKADLINSAIEVRTKLMTRLAMEDEDLSRYILPGITEFVRLMRQTRQQAGIVSASPDEFVHQFLEKTHVDGVSIHDVFPHHAVIGATTIRAIAHAQKTKPTFKPHPYSIYAATQIIGGDKNSPILYVGDSNTDILSIIEHSGNIDGLIINSQYEKLLDQFNMYTNIVFAQSLVDVLV